MVEIEVKINIKDKEIIFSDKEARELYLELDRLYGNRQYLSPSFVPTIFPTPRPYDTNDWKITCNSN